jgi:hypothetical protein
MYKLKSALESTERNSIINIQYLIIYTGWKLKCVRVEVQTFTDSAG